MFHLNAVSAEKVIEERSIATIITVKPMFSMLTFKREQLVCRSIS